MKIPCLIIAYSRLSGIKTLLSSLPFQKISCIYLAIDGPENAEVQLIQDQIRKYVFSIAHRNKIELRLWQRDKNLGIAVSIISAVDWFFSKENFGVILEDDLVTSEDFFDFVIENSDSIIKIPEIMMISGNQFLVNTKPDNIYITHYPQIWGWGTCRAKWKFLRSGLLEDVVYQRFNCRKSVFNFWNIGSKRVHDGLHDTWDIPLARFMKFNSKICIIPNNNLVTNLGFDSFAKNTRSLDFPLGVDRVKMLNVNLNLTGDKLKTAVILDEFLEKRVFKISIRHYFLPYYSNLFDKFRFNGVKMPRLIERLKLIQIPN